MNFYEDLNGKTALITGAARGLGRFFAQALAEAGVTVVVTGLSDDLPALNTVAQDIIQAGGSAHAVALDVCEFSKLDETVSMMIDKVGPIDILVNNAGVSYYTRFFEITETDWDQHVDVNLKGLFFLSQCVAQHMVQQKIKGCIINIGSIAGNQSKKYALPFCISKAGVHHLTRVMAFELAHYGIRVNAISPGLFETDLVKEYVASEAGKKFIEQIPLKRAAQPEELKGVLLLLASNSSSYMSGSIIEVDGGFAMDVFLHEDFEQTDNNFFKK